MKVVNSHNQIWLIQYESCTHRIRKTLNNLARSRMLSSQLFADAYSRQCFDALPAGSIFVLFRNFDPWILGYITGSVMRFEKNSNDSRRTFVSAITVSPSLLPTASTAKRLRYIEPHEFIKPLPQAAIDAFEKDILQECFQCTLSEMLSRIQDAHRQRITPKKSVVFNCDPSMGSDKSRGISRSRQEERHRNDALSFGRRLPGAGFSNQK